MEGIPRFSDPRLLVGTETADDAGVFRISDELALVQTVDVFTPVVDDPYVVGQIVAANCLSDVWAMGGKVLTCLNLLGYPSKKIPAEVAAEILRGCGDKIKEAEAVLCGGHTWVDPELRVGLAVTGTVHPERIITNAQAQPGDALILTKPIGTGILTFASIQGEVGSDVMEPVVRSMTALNQAASMAMVEVGVHACTDVTGFSLVGHAVEMAEASGVGMEIRASQVPVFPGAQDLAAEGLTLPLGQTNEVTFGEYVSVDQVIVPEMASVLFDPQTSGGLLISVAGEQKDFLLEGLERRGVDSARIIGRVLGRSEGKIQVVP